MEQGKYNFNPNGTKADAMIPESKPGYKAGNQLLDEFVDLAKNLKLVAKQSARLNRTYVNDIVSHKLKDNKIIERTLDSLLECVILGEGEEDFNRLLEYYKPINKKGYNFYRREYAKSKTE